MHRGSPLAYRHFFKRVFILTAPMICKVKKATTEGLLLPRCTLRESPAAFDGSATAGSTAPRHSRTALGLPGRFKISAPPRVPHTARDTAAREVLARLTMVMALSKPAMRFSMTRKVASGVTSRGATPVPPVVQMKSKPSTRASCVKSAASCRSSSGSTKPRARQSSISARANSSMSGPEASARKPAAPLSLRVIQASAKPLRESARLRTSSRPEGAGTRVSTSQHGASGCVPSPGHQKRPRTLCSSCPPRSRCPARKTGRFSAWAQGMPGGIPARSGPVHRMKRCPAV